MTTQIGPGLRRRQLAAELTRLRAAAGKDQMQAAETLDCSRPRISNLESGRAVPSKLELPALLTLYDAMDKLPVLEELRIASNERGWWAQYKLPSWLQVYIGLESEAVTLRGFALELIPGTLQTKDYARATLLKQGTPEEDIDQLTAVRQRRHQRVVDGSVSVSLVASEALLHRTAHMGQSGHDQLDHLAKMSALPNVGFRIIAFAAGGHRCMAGSFTIMEFPAGTGASVGYRENALHGELIDDPRVVMDLNGLFDDLSGQACSLDDTRQCLDTVRDYERSQ